MSHHSIYLLQLREHINSGECVYKLGRTAQPIHKRMNGYPIGSRLLYMRYCDDSKFAEAELLKSFRATYNSQTHIGSEYFEGDCNSMIDHINDILKSLNGEGEIKETVELELSASIPEHSI
jgi:hypothetical protein